MRRVLVVLPLLAAPGTSWGGDGAAEASRDATSRARAAAIAAEGTKPLPLVDPDAPVPMEIRTSESPGTGAGTPGCALPRDGSRAFTSAQCTACHSGPAHATVSHQVEVSYEAALGRARGRLRPREEAVRRGAFLPEGKVRCTSCHDGKSRLRYRLAIPAAEVRPAAKPGSARAFELPASEAASLAAAEGSEAAVKPLCLECHPME